MEFAVVDGDFGVLFVERAFGGVVLEEELVGVPVFAEGYVDLVEGVFGGGGLELGEVGDQAL